MKIVVKYYYSHLRTTSQSKIVESSANKNITSNLKAIEAVIPITSKDITLLHYYHSITLFEQY